MPVSLEEQRERAIQRLISEGVLRSPEVIRAMLAVPREKFLPESVVADAYVDAPLPIGHEQTTSALHMAALFCEHSGMRVGSRVLEVGGGCGYMACVYAEVVAPASQPKEKWGHVWSVEIVKELAEDARLNIGRTGYADRVTMIHGDASLGLPESSPFNAIIVASAAPKVPEPLVEQLTDDGVLLIPVGSAYYGQELLRITKRRNRRIEKEALFGVAFVPLRGVAGWP